MQFYTVNLNKAFSISIFWMTLSLMTIPQASVQARGLYIFECQKDPKTEIQATVVTKRPSGKPINIILWEKVPSPKKTCRDVSDRLQDFWDKGNLNFINISRANRTDEVVICGFRYKDNTICDERHKIFTLSTDMSPDEVYKKLMRNLTLDSKEPPIYQNSDDDITIDFKTSIK